MLYTAEQQISDIAASRPHLVILGAGASKAACPTGDKTGHKLPVMLDFVNVLELAEEIGAANIPHEGKNFEDVYSQIADNPDLKSLRQTIEDRVAEYFKNLSLPDEPTIYDYLVLSLRPKDAIATFNWDPFLWQALERNDKHSFLPQYFFLHGCAAVGWCKKDKHQGKLGRRCSVCDNQFMPTKLLYPIGKKDYTSDPYIANQWEAVMEYLEHSFLFTIFGYSAPTSDAAAIDLMSKAWGTPEKRQFEEIEIIDLKPKQELNNTWSRFIYSHHYSVCSDYFESMLSIYPRRSVEARGQSLINGQFAEENKVPRVKSLPELWEWFDDLVTVERKKADN